MITLCGSPISNFYNKVKLGLLMKDLPFREELVLPSQDKEVVSKSPLGKIPFIRFDDQHISDSSVILQYLDDSCPDKPALFPKAPLAGARCREVSIIIDHYLDRSARELLPAAFFGKQASEEKIERVERKVNYYVPALERAASFSPYIAGGDFTAADATAVFTLPLVSAIFRKFDREDPLAKVDGLAQYYEMIRKNPHVQAVRADWKAAVEENFGGRS